MAATSSFIVDLNKSFGDGYTGVTGTMDFLFGDAGDTDVNTYTLDLTIKNTSATPITSSSLTGFAFDTPTGVGSFTYNRNGTNFYKAEDGEISNTQSFNFCASTDNNINNGTQCGAGSAAQGLTMTPGNNQATVKYTFNFAGLTPTVDDVSTAFLNLFSGLQVSPPPNQNEAVKDSVVLAARFQAIYSPTQNDGSDKVTGKPRDKPDDGPGDEVPGPLPVLGAAAAFVKSRQLRRRLTAARTAQQNPG
ncbi:MAG: hypothetical protein KME02_13405 [Aphanothece saxicola GSE-SYN-MK-01-06B]|nr:hypothetical protein [Aphanothece saxicola GSE-SYN-MK-01-06B]